MSMYTTSLVFLFFSLFFIYFYFLLLFYLFPFNSRRNYLNHSFTEIVHVFFSFSQETIN